MQDSETPLNSSSWKLTTADKLNIGKKKQFIHDHSPGISFQRFVW